MKRRWRPGRIVIAVLLSALAVLCFFAWPRQPLWSVSFDMDENWYTLIGVDESKRIVYVNYTYCDEAHPVHRLDRLSELRGYDLYSGKLVWRLPDSDEVSGDKTRIMEYWLSPDCLQIICHEYANEIIQVRAFPSFKLQYQINVTDKDPARYLGACYSSDGMQILTRTKDKVQFFESPSGKLLATLNIPDLPAPDLQAEKEVPKLPVENANAIAPVGTILPTTNGRWATYNHPFQLSNDKRFLATVGSELKSILVFHVPSKKLLAQLPFSGIPRFVGKDNTLLLVPEFHLPDRPVNYQIRRFSVADSGVTELTSSQNDQSTNGETLCCDQRHLVTNEVKMNNPLHKPFWADWEWLSVPMKLKLGMTLYAPQILFVIHDLESVKPERKFQLPLANVFYSSYLHRNWLSSDSRLLALNDGANLALWETSPSRPLVPWLILVGTLGVCFWFAWPRKQREMQLASRD